MATISHIMVNKSLTKFLLKNPPLIGTNSGQKIFLGGFSSLQYLGKTPEGNYRFLTNTDRGPNPDVIDDGGRVLRPFLLPKYQPRIIYFTANPNTKELVVEKEILLKRANGRPISGLPQSVKQEMPVTSTGKKLLPDDYGFDLEGVFKVEDGTYWMVEEYGPSLLHFSSSGKLMHLSKPEKGLPSVLAYRKLNRGFEGLAYNKKHLIAIMQSPIINPPDTKMKSRVIRMIEFDPSSKTTLGQYVYLLDDPKKDKIGDITYNKEKKFFVIEQDGKKGAESWKKIFSVDIEKATNLQFLPEKIVGLNGSLEGMLDSDLKENAIQPVEKTLVLDLTAAGIMDEKVEGIAILDDRTIAVVVDNDFSFGAGLDIKAGIAEETNSQTALYIIQY